MEGVIRPNKEKLWSERMHFRLEAAMVRKLIASHGREAPDERWTHAVVSAVLKAERHLERVEDKARERHARKHP